MRILKFTIVVVLLLHVMGGVFAQKVRFTPRWTPQAQFVGYYVADALGFYKELGIEVEFKHSSASVNSIDMLRSGETDLIGAGLSDAIVERNHGFEIVNVMQIFQRSALLLIADRPVYNDFKNLEGLRVGHWKAGHSIVLLIALEEHNVKVDIVNFLSGINLFLTDAIDATLAMSYNERIALEASGCTIDPSQVINFAELGYNVVEDGLYTTKEFASTNKGAVEKFRKATKKGWLWAHQNPEKALDIVMEYMKRYKAPSNRYFQEKMLKEVLKLGYSMDNTKISFELRPEDFKFAQDALLKTHYIKLTTDYDSFIFK